ncbi:hypothetical protein ZWY2020_017662 [Hordeum vulgare]|nr:hypothetical protein ZWY2020_017662 [Hordeum vulgare]
MPMEQAFMHCDKDALKMAMLKHEETFRQQVHDLHRLYRIQKLLMRDLKREIKSQQSGLSASPNGSPGAEYDRRRASALDACSYEQQWQHGAARRGSHAAATPRAAQAQLSPEATDDEEAELELTLAVGSGGKKRYSNEHCSPGESFSSSTTESDTPTGGLDWQQAQAQAHQQLAGTGAGAGSPYHKRRPAGFEAVQVEDGGVQQPSPLLFHWLSLRMA